MPRSCAMTSSAGASAKGRSRGLRRRDRRLAWRRRGRDTQSAAGRRPPPDRPRPRARRARRRCVSPLRVAVAARLPLRPRRRGRLLARGDGSRGLRGSRSVRAVAVAGPPPDGGTTRVLRENFCSAAPPPWQSSHARGPRARGGEPPRRQGRAFDSEAPQRPRPWPTIGHYARISVPQSTAIGRNLRFSLGRLDVDLETSYLQEFRRTSSDPDPRLKIVVSSHPSLPRRTASGAKHRHADRRFRRSAHRRG